jgi:hypothetical protein
MTSPRRARRETMSLPASVVKSTTYVSAFDSKSLLEQRIRFFDVATSSALRSQLQACDATDPYIHANWRETVTVTNSEANDATLTKTYEVDVAETTFLPLTGPIRLYANNPAIPYVGGYTEPGSTPLWASVGHSMEFWTDATKIQFRYPAGNRHQARVCVNDRFVADAPSSTSGNPTITITFPSAGVARKVRVDAGVGASVGRYAYVAANDTIWKPSKKLCFGLLGDSVSQGAEATLDSDGYTNALTKMLGMRGYIAGKSGTGYLGKNGGAWANYRERLDADFTGLPLSLIVVQGSTNDSSYAAADITAEALLLYARLRVLYPVTPILVTSTPGSFQDANITKVNTSLKTAFDAWGDANSRWFSYLAIITSAARYNAGTTHPTTAGHIYMAALLKNEIREWLG